MTADNLDALSAAAERGPWSYRPLKHDDWGTIRGGQLEDDEIGVCWPPVASSRPLWKDYDFDAHRGNGTDPMEANGRYIVALVNAHRSGALVPASAVEAAVLAERERNLKACASVRHADVQEHEAKDNGEGHDLGVDRCIAAIRKGEQP